MGKTRSASALLFLTVHLTGIAHANTGIVISPAGHVLTADHVVRSCARVAVGNGIQAVQVARDRMHDLALLKMSVPRKAVSSFRAAPDFGAGYRVTVAGFPLKNWSSPLPKFTSGIVTPLGRNRSVARGPDYREFLRFTAPLVSGISGGPVLDAAGNLVGMAVAVVTIRNEADGENASLKLGLGVARPRLRAFLDAHKIPYRKAESDGSLSDEAIAQKAREFTVRVRCSK